MLAASFVVLGPPRPKPRAKVTRFGNYLPKEYSAWQSVVRDEASVVFAELADRGTPWRADAPAYAVGCRFFLARADGGDIDNLLGGVMDSLNKFAWPDDRRVVRVLRLEKALDRARPRVEVELHALDRGIA
jgi:hypothetical protein